VRCDDIKFVGTYPATSLGTTVYVKLRPFNFVHGGLVDLSSCPAHAHVLAGPGAIGAVSGLSAAPTGDTGVLVVTWDRLPGAASYKIYYGSTTSTFSTATYIANVSGVSQYVAYGLASGACKIYILAVNAVNVNGPPVSTTATVA